MRAQNDHYSDFTLVQNLYTSDCPNILSKHSARHSFLKHSHLFLVNFILRTDLNLFQNIKFKTGVIPKFNLSDWFRNVNLQ